MFQVFYKTERDVILSTGGELAFDKRGDTALHKNRKGNEKKHKWGENTGKVIDSVARNKQFPLGAFSFLRGRRQDHLLSVRG